MAGAGATLCVAGPPDILDETKLYGKFNHPDTLPKLAAQENALYGSMGSILRTVSMEDGQTVSEYALESVPVHDGMSSANGKLFITLENGSIVCMGELEASQPSSLEL
jgi:hypothetical protein